MRHIKRSHRSRRTRLVSGATAAAVLLLLAAIAPAQVVLTPDGPVAPRAAEPEPQPSQPSEPPATPAPAGPETYRLEVDPAPEPRPALKHRLMTTYADQIDANAVPYYYRAMVVLRSLGGEPMKGHLENYRRWLQGPLDETTRDEVRAFLRPFGGVLRELEAASRRERIDWGWGERDFQGVEAISFLLPELEDMRRFARLLQLNVRLEIADGRLDEALETFRVGYAVARATAAPPLLVCKYEGLWIASVMHGELRAFIAAPGAPNLYWALSELPRPLVDLRPGFEFELALPERILPFIKDADTADRSPAEWRAALRKGVERFSELQDAVGSQQDLDPQQLELAMALRMAQVYPQAKHDLIAEGYDAERLERMPVAQVIAIYQAWIYRHTYHEMLKWALLPPAEGVRHGDDAYPDLRVRYLVHEPFLVALNLLPSVSGGLEGVNRLEGRTAVLRALEAVRMHAAANNGRLPATLDEIAVVPVPVNPRDGQPFPYRLEGETAILELPPRAEWGPPGWRFEITLRQR